MNSKKVAFGGIIAALSLALMLLTGIVPFGTYAFPCFAGILLAAIVIEFGFRWAVLVYVSVSLLSVFFVASKEAVLYYILILGCYPMLKSLFEKIRIKWLSLLVKFIFFNTVAVGAFFISIYILSIPVESFYLFEINLPVLFLAFANVVFFIYDLCVSRLIGAYINVWRNKLKINSKF